MATTIGHLALKISAQTGALQQGMNQAERIVDKSGQKMANDMNKRGSSLWGSFFRGAFALAMFKRFTHLMRDGVKVLEETNDAASKAARQGLAEYDAGLAKISATAAKHLAPALGWLGRRLSEIAEGADALSDVFEFQVFGGGTDALMAEMARRDMAQRKLARGPLIQGDFGNMREFMKRAETVKAALNDLISPIEKFIELTDKAKNQLLDGAQADAIFQNEFKKLLDTMGLAAEVDPFAKWGESLFELSKLIRVGKLSFKDLEVIVKQSGEQLIKSSGLGIESTFGKFQQNMERLRQLNRAGAISDARFHELLGNQADQLLRERIENRLGILPDLKVRGSAEAMGTIAAFQSKTAAGEADFEKELLKLQKEEIDAAKRNQKIGERIARAVEKKPPVVGK